VSSRTVEILYLEGCPHARPAVEMVRAVIAETGASADVREVCVATEADAVRLRFLGSPTVRVDGRDVAPDATGREDFGLQCRVHAIGDKFDGLPAAAWIRDALRT
jgi:hypothetical protein